MNYDVIIIGAGPGGIFSAYELALRNPQLKVAVFEAGHALNKRHCPIDGKNIKKGEILGLENGKLAVTDKEVTKAAYKLIKKMITGESSFVTIISGADTDDENTEALTELVQTKFGDKVEVMNVNGGQPVYYYIISVE